MVTFPTTFKRETASVTYCFHYFVCSLFPKAIRFNFYFTVCLDFAHRTHSEKGVYSKRKEFAPKLFSFKVDPFTEARKPS